MDKELTALVKEFVKASRAVDMLDIEVRDYYSSLRHVKAKQREAKEKYYSLIREMEHYVEDTTRATKAA